MAMGDQAKPQEQARTERGAIVDPSSPSGYLPPLETRFPPGVSGNKGGRPKGASTLAPLLRKLAANPNEHGEGRLAEKAADDLLAACTALAQGVSPETKVDVGPMFKLMERTDGAIVQVSEIEQRAAVTFVESTHLWPGGEPPK